MSQTTTASEFPSNLTNDPPRQRLTAVSTRASAMHSGGRRTRRLACALLAVSSLLGGCAGVTPTNLVPVESPRKPTLTLKDDFSYEAYYSLTKVRWKYSYAAGLYTADRQDQDGVYYRGPQNCLSKVLLEAGWAASAKSEGKIISTEDCGIYVPNDKQQDPKVFIVKGSLLIYKEGKTPEAPADGPAPEQTFAIASTAVPSATPMQAGVGGALGGALVAAMIAAERGNYEFNRDQPTPASLRPALEFNKEDNKAGAVPDR